MINVFPPASWNYFTLVGDIGLILFMFNLGLELDRKLLKHEWKYSLPVSISTILVPYAAGASLALYLYGINDRDGFAPPSRVAFILFAASSMSFTAFPVLASILTSTKLMSTPLGTLMINCAAMNDILGWCSLALASAFAKGSGIMGLWVILISIGFVIFMFTIVRCLILLVHRFLLKRNDEMNRIFLIGIFLILIASACFCDLLGIHSFFGAFIVGIICLKSGQLGAQLYPKLQLITVELLLPLFFAASGMRTSLGSLNSAFYGGITVLIFAIATLAKFLPACIVTKIVTRRPWKFAVSVGILMNTRGLVELIALNIGLELKILSPRVFTMLIIMALVTTFLTCPLLWLAYLRKYDPETATLLEEENGGKDNLPQSEINPGLHQRTTFRNGIRPRLPVRVSQLTSHPETLANRYPFSRSAYAPYRTMTTLQRIWQKHEMANKQKLSTNINNSQQTPTSSILNKF
ncbi:unnamed protein product [Rotaria magnacalcarata]